MSPSPLNPSISLMLAVPDTQAAVEWYNKALGANLLWSLGSVAGLEIEGAAFFLHEPVKNTFSAPSDIGTTTVRAELFVDNPDEVIERALKTGAAVSEVKEYEVPWGVHRQGRFTDPFGHVWHVGDKSPLGYLNNIH